MAMSKISVDDYRDMRAKKINNWLGKPKKSKPVKEKLSTKEALRAMGRAFDLDYKKVNTVIRQWELTGII
jgi:hypothetical protein